MLFGMQCRFIATSATFDSGAALAPVSRAHAIANAPITRVIMISSHAILRFSCNADEGSSTSRGRLALHLPRGLIDPHLDRHAFSATAAARAADRGCAKVVEPDRDPHMRVGRADAVGRIECDPADGRLICFGPS